MLIVVARNNYICCHLEYKKCRKIREKKKRSQARFTNCRNQNEYYVLCLTETHDVPKAAFFLEHFQKYQQRQINDS